MFLAVLRGVVAASGCPAPDEEACLRFLNWRSEFVWSGVFAGEACLSLVVDASRDFNRPYSLYLAACVRSAPSVVAGGHGHTYSRVFLDVAPFCFPARVGGSECALPVF
jgi:hypothetical protein